MNDSLMIPIGADLSLFNQAMSTAQTSFNNFAKSFSQKSQPNLSVNTKQYLTDLKAAQKEFDQTRKYIEQKAVQIGIELKDGESEKIARELEKTNKELTAKLEKQNKSRALSAKKTEQKASSVRRKALIAAHELGIKNVNHLKTSRIQALVDTKNKELALAKEAYNKRKQLAKKLIADKKKEALEIERIAEKEKKTAKEVFDRKVRLNLVIAKTQKRIAKEVADKAVAENKRVQAIKDKAWALQQRQAVSQGRASSIAGGKPTGEATWDFAGHRGLIDSTKVVAKYGAISQALYGMQNAYRAVGAEILRFDQSIYNNMAVLGANREQAKELATTATELSQMYGGDVGQMSEAILTLGRAGFEIDKGIAPLQKATKVLAELALITGDTMADGAAGIATMVSVYPDLTEEVGKLGNQMAVVANATRLGLKDFTTISNYALTTAKSIGLSSEAYLALAGSMSKVGLNASTIGTSIRRLKKFTDSTSESMKVFFRYLGITQEEFTGMLQDSDTSTESLIAFSKQLAKVSDDKAKYTKMTKDLNIQEKATVDALRLIGEADYLTDMIVGIKSATEESKQLEKQAQRLSQGLTKAFERTGNIISQSFNDLGESISEWVFDPESVESMTDSIDFLAKSVVVLLKEVPILAAAWAAYAIRMTVANSLNKAGLTLFGALTLKVKNLTTALATMGKFNWFLVAATAAFTLLNIVSTKNAKIEEDLGELYEGNTEKLKEYSEEKLRQAKREVGTKREELEDEAKLLNRLIKLQKERIASRGQFTLLGVDRTDKLTDYQVKLQDITKQLNVYDDVLGKVSKQQDRFKPDALGYDLTEEDKAILAEIEALQDGITASVSKQSIEWIKLNAEVSKLRAKQQDYLDDDGNVKFGKEAEEIKARGKATAAEAKVKQFITKLDRTRLETGIALLDVNNKLLVLDGKKSKHAATLEVLEAKRKLAAEDYIKASLDTARLDKDSVEYKIALNEEEKARKEYLDSQLAVQEEQTSEMDRLNQLAITAIGHANTLEIAYQNIADRLAEAADSMDVLSGGMTPEQASVYSAQRSLSSSDVAIVGQEKLVEETYKQYHLEENIEEKKKKRVALDTAISDLTDKVVSKKEKEVELAKLGGDLNLKYLQHDQKITDEKIKQGRLVEEGLTGRAKAIRNAQWGLEDATRARKNAEQQAGAMTDQLAAQRMIESAKTAEIKAQNKLKDAIAQKDKTSTAEADKQYRITKARLELLKLEEEAKYLDAVIDAGPAGLTAEQEHQFKMDSLNQQQVAQGAIAKQVYAEWQAETDVLKALQLQKTFQDAINKSKKITIKRINEERKHSKRYAKDFNKIFSSLMDGDLVGAFEGIAASLQKTFGIANIGDAWSQLFSDLTKEGTSFAANMEAALMSTGWYILISFAAKALTSLLGGDNPTLGSRTDIGVTEIKSDSIVDALDRIYDVEYPMLELTRDMRDALVGVTNNITDLVTDLSFDGIDFSGDSVDQWAKAASSLTLEAVNLLIPSGTITDFLEGDLTAQLDTLTTYIKDGFFSDTYREYTDSEILGAEFMEPISQAIYDSVSGLATAASGLGIDQALIDQIIDNYTFNFDDLNTMGMSEEEVVELILGELSANLDNLSREMIEGIDDFREAGEGYYAAITRIAYETEQAGLMFEVVGKNISDWVESATILQESGGFSNFTSNMQDFMALFTEAEQEAMAVKTLTAQFADLGFELPDTNEAFIELVNSVTDPSLYADLLALSGAFGELDRGAEEAVSAIQDIADAWLSNLSYLSLQQKADFASAYLALGLSDPDSVIDPIEAARLAAETALKTTSTREEYIPVFEDYIEALEDQAEEATLGDVVYKLDEIVDAVRDLEDTTIRTA